MTAIYHDTPSAPMGPWVMPGEFTAKLTANGQSFSQPLTVKMDPRVKTPVGVLVLQFGLALRSWEGIGQAQAAIGEVRKLRAELKTRRERAGEGALAESLQALDEKAAALVGRTLGRRGGPRRGPAGDTSLSGLSGELGTLLAVTEGADVAPTSQTLAAYGQVQKKLASILERWQELKTKELSALNEQLKQAKLDPVSAGTK